jgi:hypothetical protein
LAQKTFRGDPMTRWCKNAVKTAGNVFIPAAAIDYPENA